MIQMDAQYIAQLKEQHKSITQFLEAQRAAVAVETPPALRLTSEIYTQILEDALKTIHAIIQYIESNGAIKTNQP